MLHTRSEVGKMTDLSLQLCADRARGDLVRAWDRGDPGRLESVYELALVMTEAAVRGYQVMAWQRPEQETLFEL